MFEDKVEEMIKDEVAKAVSGLVTKKGLEKVVARAITKVFEPLVFLFRGRLLFFDRP